MTALFQKQQTFCIVPQSAFDVPLLAISIFATAIALLSLIFDCKHILKWNVMLQWYRICEAARLTSFAISRFLQRVKPQKGETVCKIVSVKSNNYIVVAGGYIRL